MDIKSAMGPAEEAPEEEQEEGVSLDSIDEKLDLIMEKLGIKEQ